MLQKIADDYEGNVAALEKSHNEALSGIKTVQGKSRFRDQCLGFGREIGYPERLELAALLSGEGSCSSSIYGSG